jgi:lactate dehydrogenase-like 2-hydroxyacid dehydrogenase
VLALLTTVAHDSFGAELDRPDVEWLMMDADGTLHDESGSPVDSQAARAEVAWGTSDLFRAAGPLESFFGTLLGMDSLRWFQSPAAGYDAPVFSQLAGRGVRISNAHVNSLPIAEFVLRAVLDEFQEAERWRRGQAGRSWTIHDWREVAGSTWLVVGLGGIGTEVAVRARAFGARVIGCRRNPSRHDPTDLTVTPDRLLGVVGQADVVVLAAPAMAATVDLVDAGFLGQMKEGCILVNVARGALIDEDVLLAGLSEGRPAVAVLDVFREEPLPAGGPVLGPSPGAVDAPQRGGRRRSVAAAGRPLRRQPRPLPTRRAASARHHRRHRAPGVGVRTLGTPGIVRRAVSWSDRPSEPLRPGRASL